MTTSELKAKIEAMHKKTAGSVYQCGYNDALVDVLKLFEEEQPFTPKRFANNAVEIEPGAIEIGQ